MCNRGRCRWEGMHQVPCELLWKLGTKRRPRRWSFFASLWQKAGSPVLSSTAGHWHSTEAPALRGQVHDVWAVMGACQQAEEEQHRISSQDEKLHWVNPKSFLFALLVSIFELILSSFKSSCWIKYTADCGRTAVYFVPLPYNVVFQLCLLKDPLIAKKHKQ